MNRIMLCVILAVGTLVLTANAVFGLIGPGPQKWEDTKEAQLTNETKPGESTADASIMGADGGNFYIDRFTTKATTKTPRFPKPAARSLKDKLKLVSYSYDHENPDNSRAVVYFVEPSRNAPASRGFAPKSRSFTRNYPSAPRGNSRDARPQTSSPDKRIINKDNRTIDGWTVTEFREDGLLFKKAGGTETFLLQCRWRIGEKDDSTPESKLDP